MGTERYCHFAWVIFQTHYFVFTDDVIRAVLNSFCCSLEQLVVPVKASFSPALALVQFIPVQKENNNEESAVCQL